VQVNNIGSPRGAKLLLHNLLPLMIRRYSYHGEGDKGGEVDWRWGGRRSDYTR